jgi:hypothetical protein
MCISIGHKKAIHFWDPSDALLEKRVIRREPKVRVSGKPGTVPHDALFLDLRTNLRKGGDGGRIVVGGAAEQAWSQLAYDARWPQPAAP